MLDQEKDEVENISFVQNSFKSSSEFNLAILWTLEHKKLGCLSLIVTSDWRFSGRQERSRAVLSPVSLLTSKKTCSLSLWKHFSILCSLRSWNFQELKSLIFFAPPFSVIETDQWAQKVLVRTDWQTSTCSAYVHTHSLPSLPKWLHKSDFLRKPGWKKEWREVKQDTIQLKCSYCKEHLSNCLEYCVQCWLQCSRKAIIVLKRMRSCKIMKIMCCVS